MRGKAAAALPSFRHPHRLHYRVTQAYSPQVASVNGCVIFDLHGISSSNSIIAFSTLMEGLLLSSSCIKIFYGCAQDMQKLRSSWPHFKSFGVGVRRCLELNHLAAAVRADVRNKSLSDVCAALLGQSLDKTQRLSNWAQRPLMPEQIAYAALDAYAPIMIYERLLKGSHDPDAAVAAEEGRLWFENLCFDLPAATFAADGGRVLPPNSRIPHRPSHATAPARVAAHERVSLPLSVSANDGDGSDPAEDALESAAVEQHDTNMSSMSPAPPPPSPPSLGTREVLAALTRGRRGEAHELIHFDHDALGSGWGASKFEVFDRIQAHADAVGMTRRQVRQLRAGDVTPR